MAILRRAIASAIADWEICRRTETKTKTLSITVVKLVPNRLTPMRCFGETSPTS
ncbi:MAG: hypothetical protein LBU34_05380 [Planctomycetaceae bacterium]|nr:hypothetical protein [Planctomycetaceae bacterium]